MGMAFIHGFIHLIQMVLPYFIVGILFGALLESVIPSDFFNRFKAKGIRGIIGLSIVGAILPGCACATIPMAEGIKRRGADIGSLGAFMLTSPLLAPHTVIITFGLLGAKFAVCRVLFGLIGGGLIGCVLRYLSQKKMLQMPEDVSNQSECCTNKAKAQSRVSFLTSAWSIAKKLSPYFLLGIGIAAGVGVFMPPELIPSTIGENPLLAYGVAALIGIPVYICEGEEVPITFSLIAAGLAEGPAFTFLMGAVGTCIPTLVFAKQLLGKSAVVVYGFFWMIFAPLAGVIVSLVW